MKLYLLLLLELCEIGYFLFHTLNKTSKNCSPLVQLTNSSAFVFVVIKLENICLT